MGQLNNLYVSSSFQGLLKMTDSSQGLTNTLQTIQTGDGDNSPLQMSLTQVNISGSFFINNVPITNGTSGTSGSSGSDGTDGTSGTSGSNGSDGSSGTSGTDGSTGSSGSDGSSGTSGSNGTDGSSGTSGSNGSDGTSGTSFQSPYTGNIVVTGSIDITGQYLVNGVPVSGSGGGDRNGLITTGSITDTQFISGTLVLTSSGSNSLEIKNTVTNKGFNLYSTQYAGGGQTFGGISSDVIDFTIGGNGNIVFNNKDGGAGSGSYSFESNGPILYTSSYVDIKSNTSITGSLNVTGSINLITIGRGGGNIATNTAVGAIALRSNVLGANNIAIGSGSLTGLISGSNNIGIGNGTLQSLSGSAAQTQQNVIIGQSSGTGLVSGERNTIVGYQGFNGNNVNRNTGIGRGVLTGLGNVVGGFGSGSQYNVAVGHNAGFSFNSGSQNVFINGGTNAGEGLRSGSNNTVVGATGLPVEMNNSTIIGLISSAATIGTSPVTNSVIIADGQGNVMVRKDGSTGTVKFPTSVEITGSLNVSGSNTIIGNTVMTGSLYVSSSVQKDVIVEGQLWVSSSIASATGTTIQPQINVVGYFNATGQQKSGSVQITPQRITLTRDSVSGDGTLSIDGFNGTTFSTKGVDKSILYGQGSGSIRTELGVQDDVFTYYNYQKFEVLSTGSLWSDYNYDLDVYDGYMRMDANIGLNNPPLQMLRGLVITGSLTVTGGINYSSGSNQTVGTALLDGGNPGTVTVSNSLVTTSSLIFLTKQTLTNAHMVAVSSKGSGTFTITSNGNGDADTVAYQIINPA